MIYIGWFIAFVAAGVLGMLASEWTVNLKNIGHRDLESRIRDLTTAIRTLILAAAVTMISVFFILVYIVHNLS